MIPAVFKPSKKSLWNPQTLSNLALWLDASDASTILLNGATVAQWNDKSVQNNHLIQATASLQPSYSNQEVTFVNGRILRKINQTGMLASNGEHSLFVVHEGLQSTLSTATFVTILANLSTAANPNLNRPVLFYLNTSNSLQFAYNASGGNAIAITPNTILLAENIYSTATGTSITLINGTQTGSTTRTAESTITGNQLYVGDNNNQNVPIKVKEILYYPYALSTVNRQKAEAYLAHKWQFAASLPNSNPFKNSPPRK